MKTNDSTAVKKLVKSLAKFGFADTAVFSGDFRALNQLSFYLGRSKGFFYTIKGKESKEVVRKKAEAGELWGISISESVADTELIEKFSEGNIAVCVYNVVSAEKIIRVVKAGSRYINTNNFSLPAALSKS